MKKYCQYLSIIIIIFAVLIFLPDVLHAQTIPAAPDPSIDPDAPIDGGITLLLAAGVGYGVKKHRDNKKKKAESML